VVDLLRRQETLGCDIVPDGELRRDNFYSFVADKVSGVRLLTLAEMLEVVEDKASFEQPADARCAGLFDQHSGLHGAHHPEGAADGG
jgi:5-methyltetrahydropteroyltriglutamate--homocysteine methyltransferase